MDDYTMPKTAMVFAAGYGTRMGALTESKPKALVEVHGRPLIDYTLGHLAHNGIERVVVNTHYKAEQLQEYLHRYNSPLEITISHEEQLLETGGGLLKALPLLDSEPFFVINSDIIWLDGKEESALSRLAYYWHDDTMDSLLLVHPVEKAIGYKGAGDFTLLEGNYLQKDAHEKHPFVFAGIQLLHPRIFDNVPNDVKSDAFSLSYIFQQAVGAGGLLNRTSGLGHDGEWIHVGTVEEKKEAEQFLTSATITLIPSSASAERSTA